MQALSQRLGHVITVLGAVAWSQPATAGVDLWWHLAAGRQIWELGWPPAVDTFSFTFEGRPWLNHEWLWDAIAWGFYRLDPDLLAWANLILVGGVFAVTLAVARRESGSTLAAGAAVWAMAATSHWFIDIRPHVTTLLLVAVVLYTRESPKRLWLWPLLMVLWANLHGGFVFGVGMIGLCVLARTLQQSLARGTLSIDRPDVVALSLCLVAWLVTPWGLTSLSYPLQYLNSDSPYRDILEWQPPGLTLDLRDFRGRFTALAAATGVAMLIGFRRAPHLVALGCVTCAMAYTSRRFIPLFALTAAPLLAIALADLQRRAMRRFPELTRPDASVAATAIALILTLWLWRDVRIHPHLLARWTAEDLFPADAVRYLEALGPPKRLLNKSAWGGYLMLHLPETKVFIDGRANTLYDDSLYLEIRALRNADPGLTERLDRYAPDAALLDPGEALYRGLLALPEPWVDVYRDSIAAILVPPDSPLLEAPRPDVDEVLSGRVGLYERRSMAAIQARDADTAIAVVNAALAQDPLQIRAYQQLMILHAARRDVRAIARTAEAGLRENPRRWIDLRLGEAQAYELAGDSRRALRAYRQGLSTGPFALPGLTLQKIAELEARGRAADASGAGS